MKVLDKHKLLKGGQRSQARLERDVLRVVRHPFVARLRVSFQTETRLYLLSDFYCGGCLTEFRRDHDISKEGARFYVVELALALALHMRRASSVSCVEIDSRRWRARRRVVRGAPEPIPATPEIEKRPPAASSRGDDIKTPRDSKTTRNRRRSTVKPANVLGRRRATSLSVTSASPRPAPSRSTRRTRRRARRRRRRRGDGRRSFCGTIDYMAPAPLLRGDPTTIVSTGGLSVCVPRTLTDKPPFSRDRPRDMFCAILREEPPSLIVSQGVECADAVRGLLKKSSGERFGSEALRSHAVFSRTSIGARWSARRSRRRTRPS